MASISLRIFRRLAVRANLYQNKRFNCQNSIPLLELAAKEETRPAVGLCSRIAARFRRLGLPSDLPELRGHHAQPAELGK